MEYSDCITAMVTQCNGSHFISLLLRWLQSISVFHYGLYSFVTDYMWRVALMAIVPDNCHPSSLFIVS